MEQGLSYGLPTIRLLETLCAEKNVSRVVAVIRHSARHYSDSLSAEPFMWLTDDGKRSARLWGRLLPVKSAVSFFSSFIGRCIETAYLIDKGYASKGGKTIDNTIETSLSPYYVRDGAGFLEAYKTLDEFLTEWFAGKIPSEIICHPKEVAAQMASFCLDRLTKDSAGESGIDICVTHDWNIFAARQYLLGMDHRLHNRVEYLEGIVLFEKGGKCYITCPETDTRELEVPKQADMKGWR